ncbi:MAG: hypothetical protein K9L56_15465 [Clostridiales bacterium]|nr:hypothetical protein [Clostridiales bacterium]
MLIHWDIQQITVDDMDGETHTEYEYEEEKITITYDGDQAQLEQYLQNHQKEILLKAKGKSNRLEAADKDSLSYPTFKADSSYYGQIAEIDVSRSDKKYLKVEKTIGGQTVTAWCYVDYSLLLAHQNNDLAVGDYVVVSFVDEDLDKPYAEGKVVGF